MAHAHKTADTTVSGAPKCGHDDDLGSNTKESCAIVVQKDYMGCKGLVRLDCPRHPPFYAEFDLAKLKAGTFTKASGRADNKSAFVYVSLPKPGQVQVFKLPVTQMHAKAKNFIYMYDLKLE
jgi:hypothetical protein